MRRAVLVYNPKSGRQTSRRLLPSVLTELSDGGFEVRPTPTRGPGDATTLAREAANEGIEVVFAMGGDGTLREVAAGLLGSESALGTLPAGTANVLSYAFGLPRNARRAARLLTGCQVQEVDVGLAGETPFLMMTSSGFDASVMARQSSGAKRLLGPAAVVGNAVSHLSSYTYPEVEIRCGGRLYSARFAAISNIAYYGGPFRMAPAADFRDRRLDVTVFQGRGAAATASFIIDVVVGRHLKRSDVEVLQAESVEVLQATQAPIQVDGDVIAPPLPLTVSLAAERLRVLLP